MPAHQRLEADRCTGDARLRLIVQGELALLVNASEDALSVYLAADADPATTPWQRTLEPFAVETLQLSDIPTLDPHDPSAGTVLSVAELSKGGIHTSNLPAVR